MWPWGVRLDWLTLDGLTAVRFGRHCWQLFSQNSKLYDITIPQRHRQTDGRTDGRTTCLGNTAIPRSARLRAVKIDGDAHYTVNGRDVAHGRWFLTYKRLMRCRHSSGFAGEVVSNESAVVENASFLLRSLSSVWSSLLIALHIEIYTALRGFLAIARLWLCCC